MKTLNLNNFNLMEHNTSDAGGGFFSLLVGFFLAFTNQFFGVLGNIHITANWDSWFQAIVLGIFGSTATYFTNKFWKYLDKKFNKKHKNT